VTSGGREEQTLDALDKIDLAFETLKNAAHKTEFAPPALQADIARLNALLEKAKLPPLPVDFMYLLRKFSACKGPYFEIYGLKGLAEAQKPEDVYLIDLSLDLNHDADEDDPKGLVLGHMPGHPLRGLRYDLVYKNNAYYHVEDDRGVLTYFEGPAYIGDFILKELKTLEAAKS